MAFSSGRPTRTTRFYVEPARGDRAYAALSSTHAHPSVMHHGKFYFQHLSTEQRMAFVELLNAGSIVIGEPGFFYRPPFFVRPT